MADPLPRLDMSGPQPLLGMRFRDFKDVYAGHLGEFPRSDWPALARAAVQSLFMEWLAHWEQTFLRGRLGDGPTHPLFVLGYPRSGTTYLFNLLSQDPQLATPTYRQVWFPHTFLFSEGKLPGWQTRILAHSYGLWQRLAYGRSPRQWKDRGVDKVPIGLELPAEDSIAMAVMGQSEWMGRLLPSRSAEFAGYIDLQLDQPRRDRWKRDWLEFLRKLTYRYPQKRLLLKSPTHTAKLETIHDLFPGARFLHIARHPYRVFASFREAMKATAGPQERRARNRTNASPYWEVDVFVSLYRTLYSSYLGARERLQPNQLLELNYEDLVSRPVDELERAYRHLDLGDFSAIRPRLESYLTQIGDYQAGLHPEPCQEERAKIDRLRPLFEKFGY